MYQLNFSDQSMRAFNKLAPEAQMQLIERIAALTPNDLQEPLKTDLKAFTREGHTYYRLRAGDWRIYFEKIDDALLARYVLPQHSAADFAFRTGLPVTEETLEQHASFWDYLESLHK